MLACTYVSVGCNIVMIFLKFFAGIVGHSSALLADAAHSFSDLFTDVVLFAGIKVATLPPDKDHPYGHAKAETIAAFCVSAVLFVLGFFIISNALSDSLAIAGGELLSQPGPVAVWVAFISIVCKELLYQYTIKEAVEFDSPALLANAWHHRSDALSSIAALLGVSAAVFLGKKWAVFDPLAALVVAFMILWVAYNTLRSVLSELLEASLDDEIVDRIREIIFSVDGVRDINDLKTRRIGSSGAVEVDICVDPGLTVIKAHDIATAIETKIHSALNSNIFISVHIEPFCRKDE